MTKPFSYFLKLASLFCLLASSPPQLAAQTPDWRAELIAAQQAAQASGRAAFPLARYIRIWRSVRDSTDRSLFSGREQAEWALLMAALNRNLQNLIAFSDRYEPVRRLALENFAEWSGNPDPESASRERLRLWVHLLESDRAAYALIDSLRQAAGNTRIIINRLNEGNRSFSLQYGLFERLNADFFDAARRQRTRSRYFQLEREQEALEKIKASAPEVYDLAQRVRADAILQKIARQSDLALVWQNSIAALAAAIDPAQDLMARTFHNGSQFFGNLVGTNLFRLAELLGIGESRGHDLPAFYRYYPHPEGAAFGVHPALATELEDSLHIGDILFEKTRFAITDKLIPGYFGHVAIYLKSYAAVQNLGVFETEELQQATNGMSAAEIAAQVENYATEIALIPEREEWLKLAIMRRRLAQRSFNDAAINPLVFEALYRLQEKHENVLEALRDGQTLSAYEGGVTMNRFAHFLYVDDYAAMRLRRAASDSVDQKNLARFVALGLLQYGKPYDFRFDVNTLDAIVCSELIYQSFVNIDFRTGKSLASYTIAPDQVAQAAGIKTRLDTLTLAPPFNMVQWSAQAKPLYPTAPVYQPSPVAAITLTKPALDTLVQRAFMASVREEEGGLNLLSSWERKNWEAYQDSAVQARAKKSAELKQIPAALLSARPVINREEERRLQNLFIALQEKQNQLPSGAELVSTIMQAQEQLPPSSPSATAAQQQERAAAVAEVFQRWQQGAAYRSDYGELYSGKEKFFLGVFRGVGAGDDGDFGRGLDLQLAGNNEAPRRSLLHLQYYSFLPFHLQIFDNSGKITRRWQGGVSLAGMRRSYVQGGEVNLQALAWQSTAYASAFTPFTFAAGGDKGPLSALSKLALIGNGNYASGLYWGEFARIELAPYETRKGRRAFSILQWTYGGRMQITLGKFRVYGLGALGLRMGKFAERKKVQTGFPEIREWAFGVELSGSSWYRPTRQRLEFCVREDDGRFIAGKIKRDRQARLAYSWSFQAF